MIGRGIDKLGAPMPSRSAAALAFPNHRPGPLRENLRSDREGGGVLEGRRVLIVEDEFLVASLIEDALQSFGCETIGPFTSLELATQASRQETFDVAILDINLGGTMVFPLADELLARGIPFVFLTGYAAIDLPETYRGLTRIQKPFDPYCVRDTLEQVFAKPN